MVGVWYVGQAVAYKLPLSCWLCVGKARASALPVIPKTLRCMLSPFINNKINTGHVGTDLEMQYVMCGDFEAGRSSGEYF